MLELKNYVSPAGSSPFREWLDGLGDQRAQQRIDARLVRLRNGLFGDCKSVSKGVQELRIDYGPGYRVYFARHGETIVILLGGGDKRTQDRDIQEAQTRWQDWKARKA